MKRPEVPRLYASEGLPVSAIDGELMVLEQHPDMAVERDRYGIDYALDGEHKLVKTDTYTYVPLVNFDRQSKTKELICVLAFDNDAVISADLDLLERARAVIKLGHFAADRRMREVLTPDAMVYYGPQLEDRSNSAKRITGIGLAALTAAVTTSFIVARAYRKRNS